MSSPFRIGFGYDIHSLTSGRQLILGGVNIPFAKGLEGHSDGDCLTHAVADAILGAAGLPDIGHYFPQTDLTIENIDSQQILKKAVSGAGQKGYLVINIDTTVIAETPSIAPYLDRMKATLAVTLGLDKSALGIKATTNEKIGDLGRGKGIAAYAVCLLTSRPPLRAPPLKG